jgi:hypothetical protein
MCESGGDDVCFTLCSEMGLFRHPDYGGICRLHILNSLSSVTLKMKAASFSKTSEHTYYSMRYWNPVWGLLNMYSH